MAAEPIRINGPTPSGGAYALVYRHDDGTLEVIEFTSSGSVLLRTYGP